MLFMVQSSQTRETNRPPSRGRRAIETISVLHSNLAAEQRPQNNSTV